MLNNSFWNIVSYDQYKINKKIPLEEVEGKIHNKSQDTLNFGICNKVKSLEITILTTDGNIIELQVLNKDLYDEMDKGDIGLFTYKGTILKKYTKKNK